MSDNIGLEVAFLQQSFRFNQAGLEDLLKTAVGPDLVRRAIRVERAAKQYATGTGGGPNVRTGRLRNSITWRAGHSPSGPYVDVGTAVLYGPFVELGTSRMHARPFLRPALEAARTT